MSLHYLTQSSTWIPKQLLSMLKYKAWQNLIYMYMYQTAGITCITYMYMYTDIKYM